ncbi:hypothetical protein SXAG_00017 [Synechococcus phage S-CBS4]|nr:hypothetical protein SXAG_00017 [Synechococcus phage S-CBS4]
MHGRGKARSHAKLSQCFCKGSGSRRSVTMDRELMEWTMKPSEFFEEMAYRMRRLEKRLAKLKKTEEELILERYRQATSI